MASTSRRWDALRQREFAQYVLEEKGSYFPSLSEMKKSESVTLANVKQQIKDLENRHDRDLQNLFKHQADQYLDEALDRYLQYDDDLALLASQQTSRMDFDDPAATLGRLYKLSRKVTLSGLNDELSQIRDAHVKALAPLYKQKAELEIKEEAARRQQLAMFPRSVDEYRRTTSKDAQVRIARFLAADHAQQLKMLNEYNWVWRQVQPLLDVYKSDSSFKLDIDKTKDVEVVDPRRRFPAMQKR